MTRISGTELEAVQGNLLQHAQQEQQNPRTAITAGDRSITPSPLLKDARGLLDVQKDAQAPHVGDEYETSPPGSCALQSATDLLTGSEGETGSGCNLQPTGPRGEKLGEMNSQTPGHEIASRGSEGQKAAQLLPTPQGENDTPFTEGGMALAGMLGPSAVTLGATCCALRRNIGDATVASW